MADTISNSEDNDITPYDAAEDKVTQSASNAKKASKADRTTNVSGKVVDSTPETVVIDGTPDVSIDAAPGTTTTTIITTVTSAIEEEKTPPPPMPSVGEMKEQAVQTLSQGKEAASHALEQGKEAAGQALDQAKEQVMTQLDTRKDSLASTLEGAVQALHSTSQQFRDKNIPYVGEYADTFASQVEKASDYLRGKEVIELARDAEKAARANPIAFVGGAFILGLALARFFKSSQEGSPLAFAQGASSQPASSTALAPYSGPETTVSTFAVNDDKDNDTGTDQFGDRPLSAHGYVAGVGSRGDNA